MSGSSSQNDASRQARLLFQVLDKLPVALFAFRPDSKPAFANRAARELFGKKKLVNAGEFVAHFNLKLASDGETYPNERFPLTQVLESDSDNSVSVDDVLLPDTTHPERHWQVQAAPQRTSERELELALLFLEPKVLTQPSTTNLDVYELEQQLSRKDQEIGHLRAENEQLELELRHALEATQAPEVEVLSTLESPSTALPEPLTPDQDADDTTEAPGKPEPPVSAKDAPTESSEPEHSAQIPDRVASELRDDAVASPTDPEEVGHERIVNALDSAATALDQLEIAADEQQGSSRQQTLSTQIVALRQQLKEARQEVQNREETIRVQSDELTDKLMRLDNIEAERSHLEVRAKNAESGISILEKRLEALQKYHTQKLTEVDELQQELAKQQAVHEKDADLYAQTQDDFMQQAGQLSRLRQELQAKKEELLHLTTRHHDLVAEYETTKRASKMVADELAGKNMELRSLRQTLSHAMRATNDAIAEKERMEARLSKAGSDFKFDKTAVLQPSSGELAQLNADEARLYEELLQLEKENMQLHASLKNLEALVISLPEELLTDSGVALSTSSAKQNGNADTYSERKQRLEEREALLGTQASLGLEALQIGAPIQRLCGQLEQHFPATAEVLTGLLDTLPKLYRDLSPVFQPQLIEAIGRILSHEPSTADQKEIQEAIDQQLPKDDAAACLQQIEAHGLLFDITRLEDLFGLRKTPEIIALLSDIQDLSQDLQRANRTAAELLSYAEILALLSNTETDTAVLPLITLLERFEPLLGESILEHFDLSALEDMPAIPRNAAPAILQLARLSQLLPSKQTRILRTETTEHHACVVFELFALPKNERETAEDFVSLAQDLLAGRPHFVKAVQEQAGLAIHFCIAHQEAT